ncbi:hypothetical protein CRUP_010568 [Coryphaenoides rupestris]|nr:hypothetical protein CRUP_010568 [Coryphaenoides rupestris]
MYIGEAEASLKSGSERGEQKRRVRVRVRVHGGAEGRGRRGHQGLGEGLTLKEGGAGGGGRPQVEGHHGHHGRHGGGGGSGVEVSVEETGGRGQGLGQTCLSWVSELTCTSQISQWNVLFCSPVDADAASVPSAGAGAAADADADADADAAACLALTPDLGKDLMAPPPRLASNMAWEAEGEEEEEVAPGSGPSPLRAVSAPAPDGDSASSRAEGAAGTSEWKESRKGDKEQKTTEERRVKGIAGVRFRRVSKEPRAFSLLTCRTPHELCLLFRGVASVKPVGTIRASVCNPRYEIRLLGELGYGKREIFVTWKADVPGQSRAVRTARRWACPRLAVTSKSTQASPAALPAFGKKSFSRGGLRRIIAVAVIVVMRRESESVSHRRPWVRREESRWRWWRVMMMKNEAVDLNEEEEEEEEEGGRREEGREGGGRGDDITTMWGSAWSYSSFSHRSALSITTMWGSAWSYSSFSHRSALSLMAPSQKISPTALSHDDDDNGNDNDDNNGRGSARLNSDQWWLDESFLVQNNHLIR